MTSLRSFHLTKSTLSLCLLTVFSQNAGAATFAMPLSNDSLIDNGQGKPVYIKAKQEDSLIDIAVQYLLGQEEVVRANKNVDRWLPKAGTEVRIPSSYLLPNAPRQGVVINLPEYRLYYYPPASGKVVSYAVGIGRVDWKTPLGVTKVVGKVQNPTWTPPASIKAEHLAKGDPLPDVWPAGPDNPLGLFAFRLGIPGYLLHSTNKPQGVGMQVSHGCMRLYPKDIEQMFPVVGVGTQVNIVNQPVKVGWSNGLLYIESHPNLEGEETSYQQRLDIALSLIEKNRGSAIVNQEALRAALEASNGIPTVIAGNAPAQQPEILNPGSITSPPVLTAPPAQGTENLNPGSTLSPPVLTAPPAQGTESLNPNSTLSPPVLTAPAGEGVKKPDSGTNTLSPPVLTAPAPVLTPRPVKSKDAVPRNEIEEELRREELEEREFKNSPFPAY